MTDDPILGELTAFGNDAVAVRPDLLSVTDFPHDLWHRLAKAGLLGLCIDPAYGGRGKDFVLLSKAAEAFAEAAICPGFVMSWLGHNLMARLLVQDMGDEEQKERWLPAIASGKVTPAVAISEPGAGAHPKRLTAEAEPIGEAYCLNGEKAYVTNGSIAGLFVTIAITGQAQERKEFTAFLIPSTAPGITVQPMDPPIEFLHPAPHARIVFEDVVIPQEDVLGGVGQGFNVVSKRVRLVEDIVGLGAAAGNLSALIRSASTELKARNAVSPEAQNRIGLLLGIQATLSAIAAQSVTALTQGKTTEAAGGAKALQLAALNDVANLLEPLNLARDSRLSLLYRDLDKSLSIAAQAHKIQNQKKGAAYIEGL